MCCATSNLGGSCVGQHTFQRRYALQLTTARGRHQCLSRQEWGCLPCNSSVGLLAYRRRPQAALQLTTAHGCHQCPSRLGSPLGGGCRRTQHQWRWRPAATVERWQTPAAPGSPGRPAVGGSRGSGQGGVCAGQLPPSAQDSCRPSAILRATLAGPGGCRLQIIQAACKCRCSCSVACSVPC